MLAEQIKHILASVAIDFILGLSKQRIVYLYQDDLNGEDVPALPEGKIISVTFRYEDDFTINNGSK
jgi:hypothetical protein